MPLVIEGPVPKAIILAERLYIILFTFSFFFLTLVIDEGLKVNRSKDPTTNKAVH